MIAAKVPLEKILSYTIATVRKTPKTKKTPKTILGDNLQLPLGAVNRRLPVLLDGFALSLDGMETLGDAALAERTEIADGALLAGSA